MIRTFAAIDVGSFGLEMGIYEISDKTGIRQIDLIRHTTALGREAYQGGKISHAMVEEVCTVLNDFSRIMKGYQVSACRAYAASAMREAKNSRIVLDQIRVQTGLDVKIISNSEQRFISYKAIAARDAEFQKTIQKGTAIVDVGFGSMQVSLFDKDSLISTQNVPLGVLRIRNMLAQARVLSEVEHELVTELVDNELVTFRKMYLKDRDIKILIATGEPIMKIYEKTEAARKGARLELSELHGLYDALRRMTLDQMEEYYDLSSEYAQMLFPTAAIYERMMTITGADVMWVPGIRMVDGMAADYAESIRLLKFSHNFANDIVQTARNMGRRYKCHIPHIQAVEEFSVRVFDALKKYHGMKDRERLMLQIAANLHSCGKFVTMRDATDCAYNIIMNTEIIGLSHVEREIVANVVRYHAKEFSYDDIQISARPSKDTRLASPENLPLIIGKLTAILRLANSMDRSHKNKLAGCRLSVKNGRLMIVTDYPGDVTLEAISIEEKGDFFEEIYGIRPVLKQKRRV